MKLPNINFQNILTILLVPFFAATLHAQQDPQYTQYMYNTMSINPGYAGSLGTLDVVGLYRDQWVGIDGAPVTQNLGIHSPLRNEKIGLGLNLQNDKIGPANEFHADVNFSYTLQVNSTLKLGLGLKGGAKIFNVDFSKGNFENPGIDPLSQNIENSVSTTLGAGAYLYSDNWYLGLSVPDFITNKFYDDIEQSVAEEEIQYYLIGGYVFDLSPSLRFKPTVLAKYLHGFPLVVDVSANFLFMEQFSVGASYRYDDAISGLAGVNFLEGFFVGYSYDYTLTDLSNYNSGTHEIILRYSLPQKNKRINSPRYF
ncbi:PorP/SprF family type IX secretion system membrane protein [Aequorivita echinoideorum]|uniref:Type IX secretion system membrane protein PorP/SprF n=1 Tax=Aequorivita echinoideorum TaxID=1549647 RepID=A0ABS5S0E6_9FLAO|nr:type IX secretion system membrane protein PorP/SprF [Aequorivita echinoideorum]MBT0606694.1 type IX secretion system membrane protein PorP/SprF [Aequorivita echinoideorum]